MPVEAIGLDKMAVARRFNRSAAGYDAACRVQRRMAQRLAGRLAGRPVPRRILELGCGTGYLTALVAELFPEAQIDAVDFADRMVDVARSRLAGLKVDLQVADAEVLDFGRDSYDLIVSNAAIQWFDTPLRTMAHLTEALRPGGRMLHSTFGPATFRELHLAFGEAGGEPVPAGLPLRPGQEWEAVLSASGLVRVYSCRRCEQELYSSASEFLRELQATGVTSRADGNSGPRAPRALRESLRRYELMFRSDSGVPATYETVEVEGFRPE
ncbi:MAG TPA: malonyl-ACP O-methyltransferase BioC [Actinomycetota bacterium]|nr:malonyl-ACP O-methyltransferase BioC [Actinomycetota bacterium]